MFARPGLGVGITRKAPLGEDPARAVFGRAGIAPGDVDALYTYDSFTSNAWMTLERFGFCGEGEAWQYIAEAGLDLDSPLPMNTNGGLLSEAHLLGFGHREIAYVHGDPSYRGRMERLYGLREVLERVEGTVIHDLVWEDEAAVRAVSGSSRGGFAAAFDRLRAGGARPTAFFCAHDGLAVTVISELLARGLRIPEDASVVGFGG